MDDSNGQKYLFGAAQRELSIRCPFWPFSVMPPLSMETDYYGENPLAASFNAKKPLSEQPGLCSPFYTIPDYSSIKPAITFTFHSLKHSRSPFFCLSHA